MIRSLLGWVVIFLFWSGCGSSGSSTTFQPVKYRWHIQLSGTLDTQYDAQWYFVDLFNTPKRTIKSLKKSGKTVICYFRAGSFEDWRPDADLSPMPSLVNR